MATKEKKGTGSGSFSWLLMIVVPLVFAVTITLIVLTMAGVDIKEKAQTYAASIPGVSSFFAAEAEGKEEKTAKAAKAAKAAEVDGGAKKEEEQKIAQLTAELENKDITIKEQAGNIEELKKEITRLETKAIASPVPDKEKKAAASFQNMEAEAAAQIIMKMEEPLALEVLAGLSEKVQGAVLGEMDPAEAARLMNAYKAKTE